MDNIKSMDKSYILIAKTQRDVNHLGKIHTNKNCKMRNLLHLKLIPGFR